MLADRTARLYCSRPSRSKGHPHLTHRQCIGPCLQPSIRYTSRLDGRKTLARLEKIQRAALECSSSPVADAQKQLINKG
eukprot:1149119-Pelagomonas_calceolata.AAC.2